MKALSDPTRLRIAAILSGGPLCVNAVSARLDVTRGAVSQHLRVLRSADLVTGEKRGPYVHYALKAETFEQAARLVAGIPAGKPSECPGVKNKCPMR